FRSSQRWKLRRLKRIYAIFRSYPFWRTSCLLYRLPMCARCEISVKNREGKLLSISFSATPMQPSWIWFFDLLRPSQKFVLYPVDLECHVHRIRLIASNLQALPSWHISPSHPAEHFC